MHKQKRKSYSNNKSYYNKRSKQYILETGMSGFLCTCNFREKECIRDAYKILEEFTSKLYGSEEEKHKDSQTNVEAENEKILDEDNDGADEEDISNALSKEIAELRAENKKLPSAKKFQNTDVGVKNVIFINTTLNDPLELALAIFENLQKTKQPKTRFVIRLVPIQVVCKANIAEIKTQADKLFEKYFAQEPKTFSIVFNRHCNDKIQRSEVIQELAELVSKKNPGNKADLTNPDIAVVVEIVRGFCLLSIAPDYFKYKKYNLLELCNIKEVDKSPKQPDLAMESNIEKTDDEKKKAAEQKDDSNTSEVVEKDETVPDNVQNA